MLNSRSQMITSCHQRHGTDVAAPGRSRGVVPVPVIAMHVDNELHAVRSDEVGDLPGDHEPVVELPARRREGVDQSGEDAALKTIGVPRHGFAPARTLSRERGRPICAAESFARVSAERGRPTCFALHAFMPPPAWRDTPAFRPGRSHAS